MVSLRSTELELRFEPEQGGKWCSLCDRRTGRDWLWHNPYLPPVVATYGDSFIERLDSGGWDEIFPSGPPCGSIPDHGDLVQLPWQLDEWSGSRLAMSMEGRCHPFRFGRTVSIAGTEIHCEYRLEHLGDQAFPWLWCAHPLLPFLPEMSIEVSGSFDVLFAMGAAKNLEGRRIAWHDLPEPTSPWAAKLFSQRNEVNRVTARHADGTGMRVEWNPTQIPYLGLWVNHGAWSGCGSESYFNIGIEPAMLPVDDIRTAENPPILKPGQVEAWSLGISVI